LTEVAWTDTASKVCLITGASQGIGWALAEALAARNARVFVCDISSDKVSVARNQVERDNQSDRIDVRQCDVADRTQFEEWITDIFRQTGRIDMLVNNAAYARWEGVAEMPVEDAERTMRVAYDGMVIGVKTVLPLMQAAGQGQIVNMGSSVGRIYVKGPSASYAASKAAIDAFSQILSEELRGTRVHVLLVRLATVVGTDFFRSHVPSSRLPRLADYLPYLTPAQVANGILLALQQRKRVLDMPWWLPAFYLAFDVAPGAIRWITGIGGPAHHDFGQAADR